MTKPGERQPCQGCGRPGICATTDWTTELSADDDDDLLTLLADPRDRWLCEDCASSDRPLDFGTGLQQVNLAAIAQELICWQVGLGSFSTTTAKRYWDDALAGVRRLAALMPRDLTLADCGPDVRRRLDQLAAFLQELDRDWFAYLRGQTPDCPVPRQYMDRIAWFWAFFQRFHPRHQPDENRLPPSAVPRDRSQKRLTIDLAPQDGGGWTWSLKWDDGRREDYRTNHDYQGLWRLVEGQWVQQQSEAEFFLPMNRQHARSKIRRQFV